MVIKASSGKAVGELIADLSLDDPTRREAAVARLIVIGERAAQRLLDLASNPAARSEARVAAFHALDAIGEARAFDPALAAVGDEDEAVGVAAAAVVRSFLHTRKGITALDRLSEIATDAQRPTAVRVAAVQALASLDSTTVRPLLASLTDDPHSEIATAAKGIQTGAPRLGKDASELLADAAERELPPDSQSVRDAIISVGPTVPVTVLQQIVEKIRATEGAESGEARSQWAAVRGSAHVALAQRRSRLAIYDLRETFEAANGPVAIEFLSALTIIGDSSCLEAIAAAYTRAATAEPHDDWWSRNLADAFRTIVKREGITRRQAIAKRIDRRFPGLFEALTQ